MRSRRPVVSRLKVVSNPEHASASRGIPSTLLRAIRSPFPIVVSVELARCIEPSPQLGPWPPSGRTEINILSQLIPILTRMDQ